MHPERRLVMPPVSEPKPVSRKAALGVEPLRRKRVQPEPAVSPRGRRLLNVLLGFATVVMLVDALVGEKGLTARMRAGEEYQQQLASVHAAKLENARLREKAARLRNDPSAIEAIAREELGLIRDGELLFMVRDVKPARDGFPSTETSAAGAKPAHNLK